MERRNKPKSKKEGDFGIPYIVIPSSVAFDSELNWTARGLFGFIENLAHNKDGCFASNEYLAGLLGSSKQTVTNGISLLIKLRFIVVEYRKRSDGSEQRHIFINKESDTPLLKNLYPPYKNFNTINNKELKLVEADATATEGNLITPGMFEDFWKLYPKKASKGAALTKWGAICRRKDRPDWRTVRKAVVRQAKTDQWKVTKHIPHPATWLNQRRWMDDPAQMVDYNKVPTYTPEELEKAPYDILKKQLSKNALDKMVNNYDLALGIGEFLNGIKLSNNLICLWKYIKDVRPANAMTRTNHSEDIGSPAHLVGEYVWWLGNQEWITNITDNAFLPEAKMFKRFLKDHGEEVGLNLLTGSY